MDDQAEDLAEDLAKDLAEDLAEDRAIVFLFTSRGKQGNFIIPKCDYYSAEETCGRGVVCGWGCRRACGIPILALTCLSHYRPHNPGLGGRVPN